MTAKELLRQLIPTLSNEEAEILLSEMIKQKGGAEDDFGAESRDYE